MLRYLHARDLARHPRLAASMFRDRAAQFRDRLGWEVTVTKGEERDQYDAQDPLYVVWERPDGLHGGSLRYLPTTGPTMVNDHFADLLTGPLVSPLIWECTRFCLAPGAESRIAAALVQTANEVMEQFALTHVAAVFDARMERIGHAPEMLGSRGRGRERISLGLWSPDPAARARVAARSGVTPAQMTVWFDRSLGCAETAPGCAEIA